MKLILEVPSPLAPDFSGLTRGPERVVRGPSGRDYRMLKIWRQYNDQIIFPSDSSPIGAYGAWLAFYVDRGGHALIKREDPAIIWTVYADDMAPRNGEVPLRSLINY
jgi:hypothetical protein